ncbi:MAG: winged helix-turn-helix domain-containing protein [Candidatus Omnitrophica bacterium]|nr:winged helix-turn-helix domain-containing protein [Candidatus Omnitrophota bacterium]
MITNIGIMAGEILTVLEQKNRPLSLKELEVFVGNSHDQLMMGLGWLVREVLVQRSQVGSDMYVKEVKNYKQKSHAEGKALCVSLT